MGIIIRAAGPKPANLPLPVAVDLECDDATGFFCSGRQTFESPEGFVGCHAAAMAAGWLERQSSRGRLWLCPACSGKS